MVIQHKVVSPEAIYMQGTHSAHSMYRFRVGREVGMDLGGAGREVYVSKIHCIKFSKN